MPDLIRAILLDLVMCVCGMAIISTAKLRICYDARSKIQRAIQDAVHLCLVMNGTVIHKSMMMHYS